MKFSKLLSVAVAVVLLVTCLAGCNSKASAMQTLKDRAINRLSGYGYECTDFSEIGETKGSNITFVRVAVTLNSSNPNADYREIYNALKSVQLMESDHYYLNLIEATVDGIKYALSKDEWLLIDSNSRETLYNKIADTPYSEMTNPMKKVICTEIQGQYDYYDAKEGKYSGDKYSDIIWQKIGEKYNLSHEEVGMIWMHSYEY